VLQICSGKLFSREIEFRNDLKGIIYTNLALIPDQIIKTNVGTVTATSNSFPTNTIIYELEELVETNSVGDTILVSNAVEPYILDFCSILSFALNCTASPSYTLTERLLDNQFGVNTHVMPNQMVKQVFDKSVSCHPKDEEFLIQFTQQLLGLERKTYLGVMSAIRTYVTGMQRIADDFELAYTLLVASIESLAQDFDQHEATWTDYDQSKRKHIDAALNEADNVLAEKVREAILHNEHTSLRKRFQEFAIKHINPSFYREEAVNAAQPISRFDLPVALNNAYLARSKYIHNLKKLPKQLTMPVEYIETCRIEQKTWFTLQGLSRLTRHIISEFVMKQLTIDKEPYDYSGEQTNLMNLKLSDFDPQFWIWQIDFSRGSGVMRLEGFLFQLANCLEKVPNSAITVLSDLLTELQTRFDSLGSEDKLAYLALNVIYNSYIDEPRRLKGSTEFIYRHQKLFLNPSPAALIINYFFQKTSFWNISEHHDCLNKYFKERENKLRFRCPQIFESGMILQLAERYRSSGDLVMAVELIEMAVENHPKHTALRQFEIDFKNEAQPIDGTKILFQQID